MERDQSPRSILLTETDTVRRDSARPLKLQDESYLEKYDDTTIFYSVIAGESELIAIGPPLLNLRNSVVDGRATIDGQVASETVSLRLERAQVTRFRFPNDIVSSATFGLQLAGESAVKEVVPARTSHDIYRGKKVLMTLQKDEEIEWIIDWATYYNRVHGCDSVLLYDNGSTKYTVHEVRTRLSAITGIDTVVVVDWPFKYGPQGGPWVGNDAAWDSDFCQIGALQDARYRFLGECDGFINVDVDELIVSVGGADLFEALAKSEVGAIGFGGQWVANAPDGLVAGAKPRHFNFFRVQGNGKPCNPKWAGVPSRWPAEAHPTAHYVRNVPMEQTPDLYLAHFQGVNSAWKNKARQIMVEDPDGLQIDRDLRACLERAFPDDLPPVADSGEESGAPSRDLSTFRFQRWLDREIFAATEGSVNWAKHWTWRDSVLVFETETKLGMLAFDIHVTSAQLRLAVNVRQNDQLPKLRSVLEELNSRAAPISPRGSGYWVKDPVADRSAYSDHEKRSAVKDTLANAILEITGAVNLQKPSELQRPGGASAREVIRRPLRNLRGDGLFEELSEAIREFAGRSKIIYAPNQGNWGDGLIHKGILQFFDHFGFDYSQLTRRDVLHQTEFAVRSGGRIDDVILVSGGGGSWRNERSGNRSFMDQAAPRFARSIVLPHTFETGPVDVKRDEQLTLYVARDRSLSLESIASASVCHDMAFFLQLPELFAASGGGGTGYFMRGDRERSPDASQMPSGMDLSMQGNHLSNVTPFFQILNEFEHIVTDRMHIAIAGAMLGKRVELYPGDYAKANAVFDLSIRHNYPNITMRSW